MLLTAENLSPLVLWHGPEAEELHRHERYDEKPRGTSNYHNDGQERREKETGSRQPDRHSS